MSFLWATSSIFFIVFLMMGTNLVLAQQPNSSINWLKVCRTPIIDAAIIEPCETLTTPDGYTLTPEGERVIRCIGGGMLLLLADPSGQSLLAAQQLGSAVGCGTSSGNSNNQLGLLEGLFGK